MSDIGPYTIILGRAEPSSILDEIDAGRADAERYSDGSAAKAVKIHAPVKTEAQSKEIIKQWVKERPACSRTLPAQMARRETMGLKINTQRPGMRIETWLSRAAKRLRKGAIFISL